MSRQASCGCTLGCNVLWSGFCVGRGAVFLLGLGTVGPQPRQESARAVGHKLYCDELPALRLPHSNRAHPKLSGSWDHFQYQRRWIDACPFLERILADETWVGQQVHQEVHC